MSRRIAVFFILCVLLSARALAADPPVAQNPLLSDNGQGRIAAATSANDDRAPISANLAQASHFIVYDNQGHYLETLTRPVAPDNGPQAVLDLLVQHNITVLLLENFDDKLLDQVLERDIIPLNKQGPVIDAVTSLLQCEPNPPLEPAGKSEE